MRKNRNLIAPVAMAVGLITLALLAPLVVNIQRSAQAAVTLYTVAQGYPETNLGAWSTSGIRSRGISGLKMQTGTVTMDSAYVTGGETLDLSGTFPNAVLFCVFTTQEGGYTFEYVHAAGSAPATGLIKGYIGDGTEIGSTADVSAYVVEYLAIGW